MEIRLGDWRVAPYSSGPCWQLQKRAAEGSKEEWLKPSHYPGTLHRAVEMLVEFAARDMGGSFDLGDGGAAEMLREIDILVEIAVERFEEAAGNASQPLHMAPRRSKRAAPVQAPRAANIEAKTERNR